MRELPTSPRWNGLHAFIESELAEVATAEAIDVARPDTTALDAFLAETVLNHERERHGTD